MSESENSNTALLNSTIEVPDTDVVTLRDAASKQNDAAAADHGNGADTPVSQSGASGNEAGDHKPPATQDEDAAASGDPKEQERQRTEKRERLQKRVGDLTRERHEANERAAAAQARNELLERELSELRNNKGSAQDDALAAKERDVLARRQAALDASDMAGFAKATDELMDLKVSRASQRASVTPDPRPATQVPPDMHPAAAAWVQRNAWFTDTGNAHLAAEVERIEKRLRDKGAQLGPDLYQQIDKELESLPEFDEVRDAATRPTEKNDAPPVRKPAAPPVATTRDGLPPASQPRPGALTDYDKRAMRTFRLDPDNPKHRAAYLERKAK